MTGIVWYFFGTVIFAPKITKKRYDILLYRYRKFIMGGKAAW